MVHADIAHHGASHATDDDGATVVAESSVESVGISDGYDSDLSVFVEQGMSSVADGLAGADSLKAEDGGFEGADCLQLCSGERDAIRR